MPRTRDKLKDDARIFAGITRCLIGQMIRSEPMMARGNDEILTAREDKQRIRNESRRHSSDRAARSSGSSGHPTGASHGAQYNVEQNSEVDTGPVVERRQEVFREKDEYRNAAPNHH
ncbi:hypothetical protein DL89DRAFT_267522 [Linderina pennispora]|uniref:Uncharacterized protein n=1 Tax=Linderina pennispora TaxID=61395 RepID=A0A1Y1WAA2_9FUNG|nr:uncharacterized protein DL89DRAFT_267522 [Linderina pennispora]ORX70305.1 hypothetical protein DL89DRAFT_267522 [Linderina pennispora]